MPKIAFSSEDNLGLDGQLSGHFGRCPYYTLIDVEDGKIQNVTVVENPFYSSHQPGQVPAFVHSQNANVIIAGGMGPMAINLFNSYGIEVVTGYMGTVKNVLEAYLRGEAKGASGCGHEDHDHEHHHGQGFMN
ncbi:MAG: dinitrogenase iron-molybdenum cofactor biosynthesis protein [Deltaproteobacteria bacterium]|nr:MAG: dinitrogenase iron-molybdenum cofactor biosynthesis protein [Deltaproteobacteria bacterium]